MHEYLQAILTWAQAEEPVRAVTVSGSLARDDGTVDEWSDLDVQIIVRDTSRYTDNQDWLRTIGEVWICFTPDPASSFRLVWFADGHKVDFHFLPVDYVTEQVASHSLSDEYQRGYFVALDKDGLYERLPLSPRQTPIPVRPTPAQFQYIVDEFWFEAIHVAQYLRRRELWVVRFRDWTMKTDMLQMMEWHTQTKSKGKCNTWTIGKRIDEWGDPIVTESLPHIWAGWDVEESWQALFESMKLFSWLCEETARLLGYTHNKPLYATIRAYIHGLHTEVNPLPGTRDKHAGGL